MSRNVLYNKYLKIDNGKLSLVSIKDDATEFTGEYILKYKSRDLFIFKSIGTLLVFIINFICDKNMVCKNNIFQSLCNDYSPNVLTVVSNKLESRKWMYDDEQKWKIKIVNDNKYIVNKKTGLYLTYRDDGFSLS